MSTKCITITHVPSGGNYTAEYEDQASYQDAIEALGSTIYNQHGPQAWQELELIVSEYVKGEMDHTFVSMQVIIDLYEEVIRYV